jgi:serine/threonine protein kinase
MSEIHSVGPFILGKSLGAGATGKVKLGFHKETGFKVAVKIINKEFLASRPSMRKKVEREIVVMKIIDHPNVLKLYDVYETSKYLFLILEYVEGGELFDYLVSKGSLEPAEALHFFQQIIRGLDYCHSHVICHRDLKPENLLFVENEKSIKIGDFGMASLMRSSTLLQTSCGSPHYASPEVVSGTKYNGMMADIWSCGVILYALLSGKLPFDDESIGKLLAKVKRGIFSMPAFLPKEAQDLINKMITVDVSKRITMQGIKEHPWFKSNNPLPQNTMVLVSVEEMQADPLEDLSMIDDEILRSLKALGLGSEVDIQLALTARKPNVIMVFYRLLEMRKDNNDVNSLYPSANRIRNRRNTVHDRDNQAQLPLGGKTRSHSLLVTPDVQPRRHRRSLGIGQSHLPSSPLAGGPRSPSPRLQDGGSYLRARSGSTSSNGSGSGSSSSSESLQFPLSDPHLNGSNNNNDVEPLQLSPQNTPPSSPKEYNRRRLNSYAAPPTRDYAPFNRDQTPDVPPLSLREGASSGPININDKMRRMRLDTVAASSPPGSPIIGSNPKRSWFSNFFTGSPQTSPRGDAPTTYIMQTHKDGVELDAEIQRTLSALNTSWRLSKEELYEAEYRAADGTSVRFLMEVMNGKNKNDVDIRFVVVTLEDGPVHYFNFLCAQVHNEIEL